MTDAPTTIGFIGAGNMAGSLIGGLIADGVAPQTLWAADPNAERLTALGVADGLQLTTDNRAVAEAADVLVLAVKPQVVRAVLEGLRAPLAARRPLVISVAAGVRLEALRRWAGCDLPLVRAMPNTPALVQSGATALVAGPHVDRALRNRAESVMRAVGMVLWLDDEAQMDAVTALSGSGPAYFFLLMEAIQRAGERLGLPAETARLLTLETAFGAAKMALESDVDAATLRARVTSPGGTTERAVGVLIEQNFEEIMYQALSAAAARSRELADILGGE
ncbi:pyrroline-5-carboxylate reductase [Ectothiorhodospiraceae bacterium 2226]|nr:pyrroline-5-carboxylate reductase [Ectothiorhodospiraceae bacterium 2226]